MRLPQPLSAAAAALVEGLMAKHPAERLGTCLGAPCPNGYVADGSEAVQAAAFFTGVDWGAVGRGEAAPALRPSTDEVLVSTARSTPASAGSCTRLWQHDNTPSSNMRVGGWGCLVGDGT